VHPAVCAIAIILLMAVEMSSESTALYGSIYNIQQTYSLFQFGSHRLDSHNIHKIKSENLD